MTDEMPLNAGELISARLDKIEHELRTIQNMMLILRNDVTMIRAIALDAGTDIELLRLRLDKGSQPDRFLFPDSRRKGKRR